MSKKTVLYMENNPGMPNQWHWRNYLGQFFNFEVLDYEKVYDPKEYFLWQCRLESDTGWAQPYVDAGHKLVYENLWDRYGKPQVQENNSKLILSSHDWIFADSSIMYRDRLYDTIDFTRDNPSKFFFCPMHLEREHRTQLFDRVKKYQDVSLISYVRKGVTLPDDVDYTDGQWRQYANPQWYKSSNFSLVAETSVIDPMLISEKMFKPSAFRHPFIIFGAPFVLERLQSYGFQTFSHVIDESYSRTVNEDERLDRIVDLVDDLHKYFKDHNMLFKDARSLEIIEHNFRTFYNKELVDNIIMKQIVNPVLEFIETA